MYQILVIVYNIISCIITQLLLKHDIWNSYEITVNRIELQSKNRYTGCNTRRMIILLCIISFSENIVWRRFLLLSSVWYLMNINSCFQCLLYIKVYPAAIMRCSVKLLILSAMIFVPAHVEIFGMNVQPYVVQGTQYISSPFQR